MPRCPPEVQPDARVLAALAAGQPARLPGFEGTAVRGEKVCDGEVSAA